MKIAIVGAGLSGASVLKTIINHENFNESFSIDVYEKRDRLGVGLAYDSDDDVVMLNVDPEGLSLDQDNPNDFVEWLNENYEQPKNFEGLVSRPRFGNYIESHFKPYFDHPQVHSYIDEVTDLHPVENKYKLSTTEGTKDTIYDAVFLALGHPDYADYYNLKGTTNYIHNPYPMNEKLSQIPRDAKVGIIGSGATGMDLVRYFNLVHHLDTPPTFYVRNEPFYFAHIPYKGDAITFSISDTWINKNSIEGLIPFNKILNTIKGDLSSDRIKLSEVYKRYPNNSIEMVRDALRIDDQELAHVQLYFSKLIQFLPELYNRLTLQDKNLYHDKYYNKMILFKSLIPNLSYKWLLELLDSDEVRVVSGLKDIKPDKKSTFEIQALDHNNVDVLINATGFNISFDCISKTSYLMDNLYNKNISLAPLSGKGTIVSWPYSSILNRSHNTEPNLFLLGNLINNVHHENNDAKLIIKHATCSTEWWMRNLK